MSEPTPSPFDRIRPIVRTRQIREFTPDMPTEAEIDALLEVARWTGSSRNEQPWRFVLIRDITTLRRIGEIGQPQTRPLLTAPVAVAIAMPNDPRRTIPDAFDEGRAAERILVGATALGLGGGIAWVRSDLRGAIGEILALPADRFVRTIVALGNPTEEARRPKSPPGTARLRRADVVVEEHWPAD